MPDLDRLVQALALVALLLYLVPIAFGPSISARGRLWFRNGAMATLGIALVAAVVATVLWFAG